MALALRFLWVEGLGGGVGAALARGVARSAVARCCFRTSNTMMDRKKSERRLAVSWPEPPEARSAAIELANREERKSREAGGPMPPRVVTTIGRKARPTGRCSRPSVFRVLLSGSLVDGGSGVSRGGLQVARQEGAEAGNVDGHDGGRGGARVDGSVCKRQLFANASPSGSLIKPAPDGAIQAQAPHAALLPRRRVFWRPTVSARSCPFSDCPG